MCPRSFWDIIWHPRNSKMKSLSSFTVIFIVINGLYKFQFWTVPLECLFNSISIYIQMISMPSASACLSSSKHFSVGQEPDNTRWRVKSHPALLLQSGHHDDSAGPLLPHHPPEVTERLGERTLSGDVGVLLAVAINVVSIDVVAAWYTCGSAVQC